MVGVLLLMVAGMTVAVSYSVTLYRLFCSATGAGGTTQRVAGTAPRPTSARTVTVFFTTDVAPGMPWRFVPMQRSVSVHLGEDTPVFFEAQNLSDHDIVGHATFNVTPDKSGIYFKKIECFCFTEERLAAHQRVEMPVDFFVDAALGTDPATADVDQITLSYTFFESRKPQGAADLARFSNAPPDPLAGQKIFAADCSACHELDRAKVGPALDHVVGRIAGTRPGYPYSAALAQSRVVWTAATLDRWLAGPRTFIPGALMPEAIGDPAARRDLIAYLAQQSGERGAAQATPTAPAPAPG